MPLKSYKTNEIIRKKGNKVLSYKSIKGKIGLMCPLCFSYHCSSIDYEASFTVDAKIYDDEYNGISYIDTVYDPKLYKSDHNKKLEHHLLPYNDLSIQTSRCDKCLYEGSLLIIDPNIVDIISTFNKKGYKTLFSCEGHIISNISSKETSLCYITFGILTNKMKKNLKKYINKEYFDLNINDNPLKWYDKDLGEVHGNYATIQLKDTICIKEKENYINSLKYLADNIEEDIKGRAKLNRESYLINFKANIGYIFAEAKKRQLLRSEIIDTLFTSVSKTFYNMTEVRFKDPYF